MNEWLGFLFWVFFGDGILLKSKIYCRRLEWGKNWFKNRFEYVLTTCFSFTSKEASIQVHFVQCQFFCFCLHWLDCLLHSSQQERNWIELDLKLNKWWLPLMIFIVELNTRIKVLRIAKCQLMVFHGWWNRISTSTDFHPFDCH